MTEFLKLLLSIVVLCREQGLNVFVFVHSEIRRNPVVSLKLLVPAVLYTVQNNLVLFAAAIVDASTGAITRQFKIPLTALLSALVLGRSLSWRRWMAVLGLMAGVALVQLAQLDGQPTKDTIVVTVEPQVRLLGSVCLLASCVTSGTVVEGTSLTCNKQPLQRCTQRKS